MGKWNPLIVSTNCGTPKQANRQRSMSVKDISRRGHQFRRPVVSYRPKFCPCQVLNPCPTDQESGALTKELARWVLFISLGRGTTLGRKTRPESFMKELNHCHISPHSKGVNNLESFVQEIGFSLWNFRPIDWLFRLKLYRKIDHHSDQIWLHWPMDLNTVLMTILTYELPRSLLALLFQFLNSRHPSNWATVQFIFLQDSVI